MKKGENEEEDEEEQAMFLGAVSEKSGENEFMLKVYVNELSKSFNFVIDSGADVTCIPFNEVSERYKNRIRSSKKTVLGPDGKKLPLLGYVDTEIKAKAGKTEARIYIIKNLKNCLLGKPEIKKLDLIKMTNRLSVMDNQGIEKFIERFPKVFKDIGQFDELLKIQLKENAIPYFQSVPRTVAIPLRSSSNSKKS